MGFKRMIAIIVVLAVLACGVVTPSAAHAGNTTNDFLYAGIALGAFVGIVVIATSIIYGSPDSLALAPADFDVQRDAPEPAVRVGTHCEQKSTSVTLICW